ncbi:MAG: hypothetical protein KJ063_11340 [Anaerolineae bacterium]|nr:hypothetical protein [Anaerolineae bacterium]
MKFKVQLNGEEQELEVTRQGEQVWVTQAGRVTPLRLLQQDGPFLIVEMEQEDGARPQLRFALHAQGQERQLWFNGQTFTYQRLREQGQTRDSHEDGSLAATIPAIVSQVLVQVGDVVQSGDRLILLESMKMVIPIQAPYAGTVQAIHCTPGEAVQPGVQLLTLAEEGASGT